MGIIWREMGVSGAGVRMFTSVNISSREREREESGECCRWYSLEFQFLFETIPAEKRGCIGNYPFLHFAVTIEVRGGPVAMVQVCCPTTHTQANFIYMVHVGRCIFGVEEGPPLDHYSTTFSLYSLVPTPLLFVLHTSPGPPHNDADRVNDRKGKNFSLYMLPSFSLSVCSYVLCTVMCVTGYTNTSTLS